jgi:hypothetical protein
VTINKIYFWASDYSDNTGEGRLCRLFLNYLEKKYSLIKIFNSYKSIVGAEALNELFAQFFIRIYKEIPTVLLAAFSPPKYITSGKFAKFRSHLLRVKTDLIVPWQNGAQCISLAPFSYFSSIYH